MIGLYNSVVINGESSLSFSRTAFQKRLDEIFGKIVSGRQPASVKSPLIHTEVEPKNKNIVKQEIIAEHVNSQEKPELVPPNIVENLSLRLAQIRTKEAPQGTYTENISGSAQLENGVIGNLAITTHEGENIFLENLPLSANRFEYAHESETYYGMFFESDNEQYMVSFTTGPYKNYQLIFSKE